MLGCIAYNHILNAHNHKFIHSSICMGICRKICLVKFRLHPRDHKFSHIYLSYIKRLQLLLQIVHDNVFLFLFCICTLIYKHTYMLKSTREICGFMPSCSALRTRRSAAIWSVRVRHLITSDSMYASHFIFLAILFSSFSFLLLLTGALGCQQQQQQQQKTLRNFFFK